MKKNRTRWKDLPGWAKAVFVLIGIVEVGMLGAAHWDLSQRTDDEVNGSKTMWRWVALVNVIGPLAYFRWGRKQPRRLSARPLVE